MKTQWYSCFRIEKKFNKFRINCIGPFDTVQEADSQSYTYTECKSEDIVTTRLIPVCSYVPQLMKEYIIKTKMIYEIIGNEKFVFYEPKFFKK